MIAVGFKLVFSQLKKLQKHTNRRTKTNLITNWISMNLNV